MSIYDLNYSQAVTNLLPINHRKPRFQAWMDALLYPMQWLHDNFFNEYVNGFFGPRWFTLTAYTKGDRVRFGNAVYEALVNIGVGPNLIPPIQPLRWTVVCADWRGVYERIRYNSQKIVLEFILNKFFDAVFRQPVTEANPQPVRPDIYIDNNNPDNNVFTVYDNDAQSSRSFYRDIYSQQFILDSYSFIGNHFTIYVPETGASPNPGFYTSLQPQADAKIRAVADKYVIAGMTYDISTY